jgi:hypothetical protein
MSGNNNGNKIIVESTIDIYFDNNNVKKLFRDIVQYSLKTGVTNKKINEQYLDYLVENMKQIITKYVIDDPQELTLTEINNLTIRICVEDIRVKYKANELRNKMKREGMTDEEIEYNLQNIGISNNNINIEVLLHNLEKTQTSSNLTFSSTETNQKVHEFGKQTKLPNNIGLIDEEATGDQELQERTGIIDISNLKSENNIVSIDSQVNAALIQSQQQQPGLQGMSIGMQPGVGSSSLQSGDPTLTSYAYDEFIISIDSRNRDVARNKNPNEYRIDLKLNQQGQTRGLVQNLDQVRNVFEFTLIDAIIPNIKNASSNTFDDMYILLDIPEIENPQMLTTSGDGTRVFGKLRYEFNKDDDIFANVFTENCFKRYRPPQFLSSLPSITIRLLNFNGQLQDFGPDGYKISGSTTATNPIEITTSETHGLSTGNRVYIYNFTMDPVQLLTFSSVPNAGSFDIEIDGEKLTTTTPAGILFSDSAALIEAKLQGMVTLSTIQVSGTYNSGFTLLYTGADNTPNPRDLPIIPIDIIPNSLTTAGSPVNISSNNVTTTHVETAVNSVSGNKVTVSGINSFTIADIDATVGTGTGGLIINGLIQNAFTFHIKTRGATGI